MAEFINPALVPKVTLPSGEEVPCVGMGTFGSDRVSAEDVSAAVAGAVRSGYRMFDCAACYGNEPQIGKVFKDAFDEGVVERKDLFIMTKVWNDMHRDVEKACRKSIQDLQCDYVDCTLSTGRSQIIMHRDVMWIPEIRIPDLSVWMSLWILTVSVRSLWKKG